jgi:23S rRNA (cytosine1962-C5)-methyltransferase
MEILTPEWTEYQLLDSGNGRKLERLGEFTLIRPEPQARWATKLAAHRWDSADGEFAKKSGKLGGWKLRGGLPQRWQMQRGDLKFWVQPTTSGHVGVFPDQACHWDWMAEVVGRVSAPVKMLSLFAHTGLATLAAAAAGAHVTHVDASRKAVEWARKNQALSGLNGRPIRWIVEDALTFVKREVRRGNRYAALLLDPPKFGRGPDGEIWKLDESLPELLRACAQVLSASPLFVLLNVYTTVVTEARAKEEADALRVFLAEMLKSARIAMTAGELMLQDGAGRKISASVFARAKWS